MAPLTTWAEFDRAVRPVERLARRIARDVDRGAELGETYALREAICEMEEAYATHWRVERKQVRATFDMADAQLAPLYLATLRAQRQKARDRGAADPELDPRWQAARTALAEASTEDGECAIVLDARALEAAVAACAAEWIAIVVNGQDIGWVERKRIRAELRSVPRPAQWRISLLDRAWRVTWRQGRGGLRLRLMAEPPANGSQAWVYFTRAQGAPKEDDMGKKSESKATETEATETEATDGKGKTFAECKAAAVAAVKAERRAYARGDLEALDARGFNASLFGTNGRKEALVILYTRSKPSREVARAKGATLREAFDKAVEAALESKQDAPAAAGGDMF